MGARSRRRRFSFVSHEMKGCVPSLLFKDVLKNTRYPMQVISYTYRSSVKIIAVQGCEILFSLIKKDNE